MIGKQGRNFRLLPQL